MKAPVSNKIVAAVVALALLAAGGAYVLLWPKEPPLPPGAVRPEDAPPLTQGVKPEPGVK